MPKQTVTLHELEYALNQSAIVASTDVAGTITFVNDKFCEISQYAAQELLGANHRILNSGLHPLGFFKEMYRTIANGRVWRGEIRNRAKGGSLYWVDTTIVPFMNADGRPYQYMSIRYDISERKRAEAQILEQGALSRLGQMAAVVAHEVRNPLAGIRGALQMVSKKLPPGPEHGIVGEIVARIDTLNDLVQDILDFARQQAPTLAPVSIANLLQEKVALLSADPRFAGITFRLDVDGSIVSIDRGQIRQVLINLLINAMQATKGSGQITLTSVRDEPWCRIVVEDTGPGLSAEARAHLFEPFYTTKHRGTGLGLATARRIVEQHGGSLELESEAAGGTRATLRLPLAP